MARFGEDSVTAGAIDPGVQVAGGYVDGIYRNVDQVHARCPNAVHIDYAVHASTNAGNCGDVETGDMAPYQAPGWIAMRRGADGGRQKAIYMSLAVWGDVANEFHSHGEPEPDYIVAAYPGIGPRVYEGAAGHQYADRSPDGRNVDLLVINDYVPSFDGGQAQPAGPPPWKVRGNAMLCRADDTGAIFLVGVGGVRHIPTPDEVNALSLVVSSPAPGQAFNMAGLQVVAWAMRFGAWNYQANDFIYVA